MTTSRSISALDDQSEGGRAFFQLRMSKYLLGYGLLGFLFLVLRVFGQIFSPGTRDWWSEFLVADFWFHAVAVAICFAGWLYARGKARPRAQLEFAELTFVTLAMLTYVGMGLFIPPADGGLTVYLAATMGLFARSIFVPSTARRSLVLAIVIAIPASVAGFVVISSAPNDYLLALGRMSHQPSVEAVFVMHMLFQSGWWVGTIVMTTAASKVIYGLRQEAHDARKLGQYQLEEKLGEGGMGIVYRASHALLQRPTAVKLLPEDRVGDKSIERFEREVRLTARLTHPNTITVFDYGRTPEGVFYYAMELLEGATLEAIVEHTGPLNVARATRILSQIAAALSEAHGIGLIHRDIKPANIMLCEQGGVADTVKVLDFGLVKEIAPDGDAALTQANVVTGTPQYMPPEALTDPDSIDARSDIYSLGAVAFFIVTGEPLFDGKTAVEVCGHHLHTTPRRCSELVDVPKALDDLIDACLAKKPADRPQSAEHIVDALEATDLSDAWTRPVARAWWDEHGEAVGRRSLGLREVGDV